MITKYFALRDVVVQHYGNLVMAENKDAVKRSLKLELMNNEKGVYSRFPNNFDLYQVAEFDDESGEVRPVVDYVCNLSELIERE